MVAKRGSARRKGDEYQDATALSLVLQRYIGQCEFEAYLEYEKAGNLDDVVVFEEKEISAFQIKYAVNNLDVYSPEDLTDPSSPVFIKKFATSWKDLRKRFPDRQLTAYLLSNRGLDKSLLDLVDANGCFTPEVIENRRRKEARKVRKALVGASGLSAQEFERFLSDFQFLLKQPTLSDLEQNIKSSLLDQKLGIPDSAVYLDLKEAIKQNAINSHEAITPTVVNQLLEKVQSKLLLPQVFDIDEGNFVKRESLASKLDCAISHGDGTYVVVTGLPGSGKSTSITSYMDNLDKERFEAVKYYCFVDVNDSAQRIRIQADSLRANLLDQFHRRYPQLLERRFDYGEHNFLQALEKVAESFSKIGKTIILFLDGLDHVERLSSDDRNSVITALPPSVPKGMTIVVGTQELHRWPHFLKRVKESPEHHVQMPLFTEEETKEYLSDKRGFASFTKTQLSEIHKKSEGLPLYLQYAAAVLNDDELDIGIPKLKPAESGDIRNYYSLLWEEFEQHGMGASRHLCVVLSCLRFGVLHSEFFAIQNDLSRPEFEDAYNTIAHLLKESEARLTIFHNSFREFSLSQINDSWAVEINGYIFEFLKRQESSPLWFRYVFMYAQDSNNFEYILSVVSADFVDKALAHCRPNKDILEAIDVAINVAFRTEDIVQLSRLQTLGERVEERLKHYLDRTQLSNALLALGRENDVLSFAYSAEGNQWLVDSHTALLVMVRLGQTGNNELGKKLFDVFTEEYEEGKIETEGVNSLLVDITKCLAFYVDGMSGPLAWMSSQNLHPKILDDKEIFAPAYAPLLEAYCAALATTKKMKKLLRINRISRLYPNILARYMVIRALANQNAKTELNSVITEFITLYPEASNLQLAYYAAIAGLNQKKVSELAGTIETPSAIFPEYIKPGDPYFKKLLYSAVVLGYEGSMDAYEGMIGVFSSERSLWRAIHEHVIQAGYCYGQLLIKMSDCDFEDIRNCINSLMQAEQGEGERVFETIDLARNILKQTFKLLTCIVLDKQQEKLGEWLDLLHSLRESYLWTTHYGINEVTCNYSFELEVWDILTDFPEMHHGMHVILKSCVATYVESTNLKGGLRSDHFLRIASIFAKCGNRDDALEQLYYGLKASLIYGYRKDPTLSLLMGVAKEVNKTNPNVALQNCGRILSMVSWMPHLTDGRTTKWFVGEAFDLVMECSRSAAFKLLFQFRNGVARWKMNNCVESFIRNSEDIDLEYLWCLGSFITNHDSSKGEFFKQILNVKRHVFELAKSTLPSDAVDEMKNRLRNFVLTEVSPRCYPSDLFDDISPREIDAPDESKQEMKERDYQYQGKNTSVDEIEMIGRTSFECYLEIFEELKSENKSFYEPQLEMDILLHHIEAANDVRILSQVQEIFEEQGRFRDTGPIEALAKKYRELGCASEALDCYSLAFGSYTDSWRYGNKMQFLETVAGFDRQRATNLLLKECYESRHGTASLAAKGLATLGEHAKMEKVFYDFLEHCESMFAQMPQAKEYDWLINGSTPAEDIHAQIVNLVVDELDTPEIDHGKRLVKAISDLATRRPKAVIPIIFERLTLASSGIVLRRLLMILLCVAEAGGGILCGWEMEIASLLDMNDFYVRKSTLEILARIECADGISEDASRAIRGVERAYSPQFYSSTYKVGRLPSSSFSEFFEKGTLFVLPRKIDTLEQLLRLAQGELVGEIEQRLELQQWSIGDEKVRLKDDWRYCCHPQGHPCVWISTQFQEAVYQELFQILDEAAQKMRLSEAQLEHIWRTIQTVDPEQMLRGVSARPEDIQPLIVEDGEAWLAEFDALESFAVINSESIADEEWMTVCEDIIQSVEEEYSLPYAEFSSVQSYLLPMQVYGGCESLQQVGLFTEQLILRDYAEMLTFEQARGILVDRKDRLHRDDPDGSVPLISRYVIPGAFMGSRLICSLASNIIYDFQLTFDGLDLLRGDERIARFEVWEEGYRDESYSRDKLSFGARLQVKKHFLIDVCNKYGKLICVSKRLERTAHGSIYSPDPDKVAQGEQFMLYHL